MANWLWITLKTEEYFNWIMVKSRISNKVVWEEKFLMKTLKNNCVRITTLGINLCTHMKCQKDTNKYQCSPVREEDKKQIRLFPVKNFF